MKTLFFGLVVPAQFARIKEAQSAMAKDAREIGEGVASLTEEIREIRALINQMREMFLSRIGEERKAIQDAAESLLDISAKWILMAIAAAYMMGLVSYPVILALESLKGGS